MGSGTRAMDLLENGGIETGLFLGRLSDYFLPMGVHLPMVVVTNITAYFGIMFSIYGRGAHPPVYTSMPIFRMSRDAFMLVQIPGFNL